MKIIDMPIGDVVPYKNNPRRNDAAVKPVMESLKEFGWKQPIVIDKNNVIVCGHTRLRAAKRLKMKTVPCVMADDLTPEQIKAFRLADNKTAEFASWDMDMLNSELLDIKGIDMGDFGLTCRSLNRKRMLLMWMQRMRKLPRILSLRRALFISLGIIAYYVAIQQIVLM